MELGKYYNYLDEYFSQKIQVNKFKICICINSPERKIVYDYDKYGDTPTCLNDQFDISGKNATTQGFGNTEKGERNDEGGIENLENIVITMSNEECCQWIKNNASSFDADGEIAELPQGLNRYILCTRGFPSFDDNGNIQAFSVSKASSTLKFL